MAVLSSILGRRESTPAVGAQMISTTELPPELRPYYKDILTKAQALYNDRTSQGYQPYTGPTIAEFTPEQQQVQAGIAGLVGSGEPLYQEAMGMTREAVTPFTAAQVEEYMSPYQQAVTDIEKREATKQFESQVVPELAAKAAMAQPFGGSRQAILEGMAADTQQRLLGDIQAKGSAQAYQDAISRLDADRLAKGQAATQLANLGSSQFKQATTELSGLQSVGQEKQRQSQTALDEAFKQYLEEQQFPYDTMAKYQSVVTGAPLGNVQYVPPQPAQYEPSLGQQLIGGLGGLGNIYGAFTGRTIGGQPLAQGGAKTGGGIGTLIKRANGGSTNNNEDKTFKENFGLNKFTLEDLQTIEPDAYLNYLRNLQGPYSERYKKAEELTQQRNKLMEKDLKRDRSYLEADRANQQFNREQAAFSAMARLGIDQDVTDAPGGGAGQLLTMLAKAGPEIGAAETKQRAKIRQQDREVGKLEIKYKDAIAKGDLELANTYMAQLQNLSAEYAKYMTAKSATPGSKLSSTFKPNKLQELALDIVGDKKTFLSDGSYKYEGKLTPQANELARVFRNAEQQMQNSSEAKISVFGKPFTINVVDFGAPEGTKFKDMVNETSMESMQEALLRYIARISGLEADDGKGVDYVTNKLDSEFPPLKELNINDDGNFLKPKKILNKDG
mgnify:FL=1